MRADEWLQDYSVPLSSSVGTALIAGASFVLGIAPGRPLASVIGPGIVTVVGMVLGIASVVRQVRDAKTARHLETESAELREALDRLEARQEKYYRDYREIIEDDLRCLASRLGFNHTERVTIYKHEGQAFIALGRYSPDPELSKMSGRFYPDSEGALGKAWREGYHEVELPDPNGNSKSKTQYFKKLSSVYSMSDETARKLRMLSRCYFALALHDPRDRERVAVIVFESLKSGRLHSDKIKEALDQAEENRLVRQLIRMKEYEPDPGSARKAGF